VEPLPSTFRFTAASIFCFPLSPCILCEHPRAGSPPALLIILLGSFASGPMGIVVGCLLMHEVGFLILFELPFGPASAELERTRHHLLFLSGLSSPLLSRAILVCGSKLLRDRPIPLFFFYFFYLPSFRSLSSTPLESHGRHRALLSLIPRVWSCPALSGFPRRFFPLGVYLPTFCQSGQTQPIFAFCRSSWFSRPRRPREVDPRHASRGPG